MDENDDKSKYGEFVSSYFEWLTLAEQKERANQLNEMTKTKNNT